MKAELLSQIAVRQGSRLKIRFAARLPLFFSALLFSISVLLRMSAFSADIESTAVVVGTDVSYNNELQHAIDRGLAWLQANQNSNGWWSVADQPAVTALALMAFEGEPKGRFRENKPDWLDRGYGHILGSVQADGGIHRTNLVTYNTSLCTMALVSANRPEYEPIIHKARQFLIGLQRDFGEKGKLDNPFDGGIGYGSHYDHSDMGNTLQALEALYYSKQALKDRNFTDSADLNWDAAIRFLQSCQNLPGHNSESWVSDEPRDKGGFIYYPGHTKSETTTNVVTGRVALRSYGSISYAGMLSYMYADLKRDDPRVKAVFEWLQNNYTLDENPAMGLQGLFFYYRTMTKALTAYGVYQFELADGRKVNWRRELSQKLLNLQQRDGSWINENGRWWERDSALVTSYVVLTLEMIYSGL